MRVLGTLDSAQAGGHGYRWRLGNIGQGLPDPYASSCLSYLLAHCVPVEEVDPPGPQAWCASGWSSLVPSEPLVWTPVISLSHTWLPYERLRGGVQVLRILPPLPHVNGVWAVEL